MSKEENLFNLQAAENVNLYTEVNSIVYLVIKIEIFSLDEKFSIKISRGRRCLKLSIFDVDVL